MVELVLIIVVYFLLNIIFAICFQKVAALKGYGSEVHAFAIVFWFGLVGCIYVVALPDRVLQEQNQEILDMLAMEKEAQ